MKRPIVPALVLLAAAVLAAPAFAADVNLNWYPFSARSLDKDYWAPLEDQYAFGGTVDFGESGWPIHMAVGLHTGISQEEFDPLRNDARAIISELSVGVTKVWGGEGKVRPFVGGGFSFVHAELETDLIFSGSLKDDDAGMGLWIEGGVYWRLGPHFNLGLHGRLLEGSDITLFGEDGDADYVQFGPLLGWSWPARR